MHADGCSLSARLTLLPPLTSPCVPLLTTCTSRPAPQRKGDAETQLRQKQTDLAAAHSEYAQVVAALEEVTSRVQEHQRTEQELNSKIKQCNGGGPGCTCNAASRAGAKPMIMTVVKV